MINHAIPETSIVAGPLLAGSVEKVALASVVKEASTTSVSPMAVKAAGVPRVRNPQMHQTMLTTWRIRPKVEMQRLTPFLAQTPTMKMTDKRVQSATIMKPTRYQVLKT